MRSLLILALALVPPLVTAIWLRVQWRLAERGLDAPADVAPWRVEMPARPQPAAVAPLHDNP